MPQSWSVEFSDRAREQRAHLTAQAKGEVNRAWRALADGPYGIPTAIELRGFPGVWRIRLAVGNRRLIYHVNEEQRSILVLDILRREEAYEKYPLPDDD